MGHGRTVLHAVGYGLLDGLGVLVAPPRVGVVVYPRVAGELVGSREAFGAAGELAGVRLLAGVGSNMAGLVLQTVESLVTKRAFVGSRQVLAVVPVHAPIHVWHHTDGCHFSFVLLLLLGFDLSQLSPGCLLVSLNGGLRVQQT
jgi:hypothetical protein